MQTTLLNWEDTITALATPNGSGALAIIRISGKNTYPIVQQILEDKQLNQLKPNSLHFCQLVYQKQLIDEVVLSLFKSPNSYTGEDIIEISCHGSSFIIERILQILIELGARLALPGEFTQRAFMNGKLDLIQAEAVSDLIASHSNLSHQAALHNLKGHFSNELKEMRSALIEFSALIELELDFSQEDVAFADRSSLKNLLQKIHSKLLNLINSFEYGNAIKNGVKVAIIGKPNAGKSTLLNTLLQENRAIVSSIPGTTRDTIEEILNIQGILFRLIDTAGIHFNSIDEIEQIGINKSKEAIEQATIIIFIYDCTSIQFSDFLEWVQALISIQDKKIIFVANKIDEYKETIEQSNEGYSIIPISAKNKIGIDALKNQLVNLVTQNKINAEGTIITNTRHLSLLKKILISIQEVNTSIDNHISSDLIALEIREALFLIGSLTGEVTNDDKLDYIFSKFCIGK